MQMKQYLIETFQYNNYANKLVLAKFFVPELSAEHDLSSLLLAKLNVSQNIHRRCLKEVR